MENKIVIIDEDYPDVTIENTGNTFTISQDNMARKPDYIKLTNSSIPAVIDFLNPWRPPSEKPEEGVYVVARNSNGDKFPAKILNGDWLCHGGRWGFPVIEWRPL